MLVIDAQTHRKVGTTVVHRVETKEANMRGIG